MSMAVSTQRLYTIEDLEALDGEFELDRGVLVPVMPGLEQHGFVCGEAYWHISSFVRQHRLGRTYVNDTGFVLERSPDTLRGPDVAFIRQDRLSSVASDRFVEGGPDLAVEVVSPGGSLPHAMRKAAQYLEAGTSLVWILDIGHRRAIVFHHDGEVQTLSEDAFLEGRDALPGFSVQVCVVLDGDTPVSQA